MRHSALGLRHGDSLFKNSANRGFPRFARVVGFGRTHMRAQPRGCRHVSSLPAKSPSHDSKSMWNRLDATTVRFAAPYERRRRSAVDRKQYEDSVPHPQEALPGNHSFWKQKESLSDEMYMVGRTYRITTTLKQTQSHISEAHSPQKGPLQQGKKNVFRTIG